jgi:hypothetical protein
MVRVMAELDYAFIAEFAKVENEKLTAVGASYLEVRTPAFPVQHSFSVARPDSRPRRHHSNCLTDSNQPTRQHEHRCERNADAGCRDRQV